MRYAVSRYFIYLGPVLVFMLLLKGGVFDFYNGTSYEIESKTGEPIKLRDWAHILWIFIFTLPAVWVWRRPILKLISFLNKVAEGDRNSPND